METKIKTLISSIFADKEKDQEDKIQTDIFVIAKISHTKSGT